MAGLLASLWTSGYAVAATAPPLGAAQAYAVLAGSAVTNTGSSVLAGELGISPGNSSSVTGFPPGSSGATHFADAAALAAQTSTTTAYNQLAGQPVTVDLSGQDLGGLTLVPGAYNFSTSAQLTGTLTLNAQGDPNAVFVFKTGSTLTTASGAVVQVINSGSNCNVFWQVGSSATLGTGSSFIGDILALTNITLNTGASLNGRALARNGAVTLDTNAVSVPVCQSVAVPTVQINQISNGGVAAFSFSGSNGLVNQTVTTLTPGVAALGAAQVLGAAGAVTTITAALPPAGYALDSVSCTGLGAGGTQSVNTATRTVTLDAAATAAGSAIVCTFTNTLGAIVVPPVTSIPSLSEWGLILLAGLMAIAGFVATRRVKNNATTKGIL